MRYAQFSKSRLLHLLSPLPHPPSPQIPKLFSGAAIIGEVLVFQTNPRIVEVETFYDVNSSLRPYNFT